MLICWKFLGFIAAYNQEWLQGDTPTNQDGERLRYGGGGGWGEGT
jgi:hypothetical protein